MDVASSFSMLGLIVLLLGGRLRLPHRSEVPLLPSVLALLLVWIFHWHGWDLGLVASDEVAHFLADDWSFPMYVRSDPGMPSRLYLTFAWFLLPWQGLAGIRLMNLVLASLSTVLFLAACRRAQGRWGAWSAFALLLYYPWLRYGWEARAYPIFLLAVCLALWQAVKDIDTQEGAPPLDGLVLCLAFASFENPVCALLAIAAVLAKVRRCGWLSISRRSWHAMTLLLLMVFPLVIRAVGAHQVDMHADGASVNPSLLVLLAMTVPGLWTGGRRGWLAETSAGAVVLLAVGMLTGAVPGDDRVMLFVLPWCMVTLLLWVRTEWWSRSYWLPTALAVVLFSHVDQLVYQVKSRAHNVDSARSVYAQLTKMGADRVRFVPNHTRTSFLSASFDLRHIQHRYFAQHHASIPPGYRSKERPECSAGEFVVEWRRDSPTCDCPVVVHAFPWRAYHCSESAEDLGE